MNQSVMFTCNFAGQCGFALFEPADRAAARYVEIEQQLRAARYAPAFTTQTLGILCDQVIHYQEWARFDESTDAWSWLGSCTQRDLEVSGMLVADNMYDLRNMFEVARWRCLDSRMHEDGVRRVSAAGLTNMFGRLRV